jgi:hypothetical protein
MRYNLVTPLLISAMLAALPAPAQVYSGPPGAVATGATQWRSLAAMAGDTVNVLNFSGVDPSGAADSSTGVQAALTAAGNNNQRVLFPHGTYLLKGLSVPSNVDIACADRTTTIQLPNGANTWIFASSGYVNNTNSADQFIRIENCTIDGNKTNNTSSPGLVVLKTYEAVVRDNVIQNSPGVGLLYTAVAQNGTTLNTNGLGNNRVEDNLFANNVDSGIYGKDQNANQLGDLWVSRNQFGANATSGTHCQLHSERSANFHVTDNQFYSSPNCNVFLNSAGADKLTGNDFDSSADTAASGTIYDVELVTPGGSGNISDCAVAGNTFRNAGSSIGSATALNQLEISQNNINGRPCAVSGNSFLSMVLGSPTIVPIGYATASNSSKLFVGQNGYSSNLTPPAPSAALIVTAGSNAVMATANTPTGTTSTSDVMMGLGASFTITPATTGKVAIVIAGQCTASVGGNAFGGTLRYGTGTAPANGAAATGTTVGNGFGGYSTTGGDSVPCTVTGIISGLAVGTTYWIDLGLHSGSGSSMASVSYLTMTARET